MEIMDLTAPQVPTFDADEVVQLTQKLHDTLNEFDNQFSEFLQEIIKTVPYVASVTP
jgi:hypothetical protein